MTDKKENKPIDKTSFLYQILEDVYNASSLCRPDIEQNHIFRSHSFSSKPSNKNNEIKVNGISAPTTLKNYHIKSKLDKRNNNHMIKKKLKRPSSTTRPLSTTRKRTRAFYKNTNIKEIETKCKNNKLKRPSSAPSYSLNKKYYKSTSNLIFTPRSQTNKLQILNLNEIKKNKNKHNSRINSFTHSYLINDINHDKDNNNFLINCLSRSKFIENYIRDKKENLYNLDEFATLKIQDLDRMNNKKKIIRDRDKEFESMIPNLDNDQNDKENVESINIESINIENRVNDISLRLSLYIDLLFMISQNISSHSLLLKFITNQIIKYLFINNKKELSLSKLCKLSTYFENCHYYKEKYQILLKQIENDKKIKGEIKREKEIINKLNMIKINKKTRLKTYFIQWKLLKNLRKFKSYYNIRKKVCYLKQWKMAWYKTKIWNLESNVDSLKNELNRKEMYNQLYIGQNKNLLNQLKQYKQTLTICIDFVNQNENCNLCSSIWQKKFNQYVNSLKVRHCFIKELVS